MKLSICMMVKNEEKNLPRCLEKINPLIEAGLAELIIIDTGSKDKSIDIAKQYTNKVYFHKWNKNFSEMRNISISYAKGEWLFILDADERLDDVDKLITLINSPEINKYNTVIMQVKNLYQENDESKYNLIASPRLFRNDGEFRFEGAVHNQPIFKGPNLSVDINLTHFGYIIGDKKLMELKYARTTELLKLELEKNPENLYYLYQLGVSYDMHGDHREALIEFRKAYSILNNKSLEEKKMYVYIYASYARIAYTNNEFKETLEVAKEAETLREDYIDLYYLLGISEIKLGNKEQSTKYLQKYLSLVNGYNELEISKDMTIIMYHIDDKSKSTAYFQLTKNYIELGKYRDAYKIYNNITNLNEKIYASINVLVPLEKYSGLRVIYNSFKLSKDKNSFLSTLEEKTKKLDENQKLNLYNEFSLIEDSYGLFNKVRIANNLDEKKNLAKLLLEEIDFNKSPLFYSEIFEIVKDNTKLMIDVFKKIEVWNLRRIVKYLIEEKEFKVIFENIVMAKYEIEAKVFISIVNVLLLLYIEENNNISEKYLSFFKAYLNMGISFVQELYSMDRAEVIYKNISNHEDRFFIIMYIINKLIKDNNKKSAVQFMIEAVNTYEPMAKYIDLYKNEIFNLQEEKNAREKNKEFEDYKQKVKENINDLVNNGFLEESKKLINEYEEIIKDDVEIYSMKAIVAILENKFEEAELILKEGLALDENNFDLTFNLAYIFEQTEKFNESLEQYKKALINCNDEYLKNDIITTIQKISSEHSIVISEDNKKIAFFVKQGMDGFLEDIINGLSNEYETKKIIVRDYKQIDDGMQWADICWFEWCDELVGYGSKLSMAEKKKIICRVHRYEAFTSYIENVDWHKIDKVIFVSEHIRDVFLSKTNLSHDKCEIVHNGINLNKFKYYDRKKGFNLAWIGYINLRKNPMLVIQYFNELVKIDNRYKLFIAGSFQDETLYYYLKEIIDRLNLHNNIQFDGFIQNAKISDWLKDKNYILTGSIAEGHPVGVMEAMASGLKPVIHYFPGCEKFYPKEYIYNQLFDFINIINEEEYHSKEYFDHIKNNYSHTIQMKKILDILSKIRGECKLF